MSDSKKWLKAALKRSLKDTVAEGEAKALRPSWKSRAEVQTALRAAEKATDLIKHQIGKQRFRLTAPSFTANNDVWRIEKLSDVTHLKIAAPDASVRGNHVWTDLPEPLRAGAGFEMTLEWTVRTSARSVNVHIRNPETGAFKVVGTIAVDNQQDVPRTDTISFVVPKAGFSQIMFGAIHFSGVNAGADLSRITIRSIRPEAVVPNAAPLATPMRRRDAATVVKELSQSDDDRFIGAYAQHRISRSIENARSLLMFHSHGFEKGLSRTVNFRPGFGEASMSQLSKEMNKWVAKARDPGDPFFQVAASVMRVYFDRHASLGVDVSHFWKLFDEPVQEEINKADVTLGGALPANLSRELAVGDLPERNFVDVVFARRSVREFTPEPVADEDIQRAVQMAIQAPSVCNRQPVRVHQFEDKDAIRAALDLQGGFRGYKLPPKLLLVTSDLSVFVAAVERNQAFVDGGLFMMLLLLALEQVGLGSCSLNTAMNKEREESIRKILNIPDSEVFISFVAVGHYDPTVMVPRSKRITVDEVLIQHGGVRT